MTTQFKTGRRKSDQAAVPGGFDLSTLRKTPWPVGVFRTVFLVLADLGIVVAVLIGVVYLRSIIPEGMVSQLAGALPIDHYVKLWWILPLWLLILTYEGLYTRRMTFWDDFRQVWRGVILAATLTFAIVAMGQLSDYVSRLVIVMHGLLLLLVLPLSRLTTKRVLYWIGLWRKPVLIVGSGDGARSAIVAIDHEDGLGYDIIGCVDDDPARHGQEIGTSHGHSVTVLGPIPRGEQLLRDGLARDVIIATPHSGPAELTPLVLRLQKVAHTIRILPDFSDLPVIEARVDRFTDGKVLLMNLPNNLAKPWNRFLKRSFDLVFGGLLLILVTPFLILLGLIIRLDSPGSALFRHSRLGRNGRPFNCLKLRTMHVNADDKLDEYLAANPMLRQEWSVYNKLKSRDPRVTRIGRFLRRFSLDEFPQLFNVVAGTMSLVGPRPYLAREMSDLEDVAATILNASPGMTGLWQVSGRSGLTFKERVFLDTWYSRNWSPWLDMIILLRTVRAVFQSGTAF